MQLRSCFRTLILGLLCILPCLLLAASQLPTSPSPQEAPGGSPDTPEQPSHAPELTERALGEASSSHASGDAEVGGVRLWLSRPPHHQGIAPQLADQGFVRRSQHQLLVRGSSGADVPYYFLGFNAYWLNDKASWGREWGRRQVAELMAAAQRLGMTVGRAWAFNSRLPEMSNQPGQLGNYSKEQFEALDFVIYTAGRFNMRLILALGNFWPAYFSPEKWLYSAKGSASAGLCVFDFYNDSATRSLYKQHISTLVNRVNTFTGIKYKDDPAIFGFDVLNEPRCPRCPQHMVHSWMKDMMSHFRYEDPNHLILMGTEGFFMPDEDQQLHQFNPGAGSQCEGEDWRSVGRLRNLDISTMHVYERHMEKRPAVPTGRSFVRNPDWYSCGFECYINWVVQYVQLHLEVNEEDIQKPVVIEEFGLTWWRSEAKDVKVVVEVMRQMLVHSARTNGALAGIMLWSAAHNESDDQDGYNIKIDRWPQSIPTPSVRIKYPITPRILGSYKLLETPPYDGSEAGDAFLNKTRQLIAEEKEQIAADLQRLAEAKGAANGRMRARALHYQQDQLDGFRRGWQRGDCAHAASRTWRPMPIDTTVVNVTALRAYTAEVDVVDILARTSRQLEAAMAGHQGR